MHFAVLLLTVPGSCYRVETPILAVHPKEDRQLLLKIPAGAEVYVVGETPGTPFTEVIWQSEPLLLFAQDLYERARRVSSLFDEVPVVNDFVNRA